MAQTLLIAAPAKAANGKVFRVVKDRAWEDMPWIYLVQVQTSNYQHGARRRAMVAGMPSKTQPQASNFSRRRIHSPDHVVHIEALLNVQADHVGHGFPRLLAIRVKPRLQISRYAHRDADRLGVAWIEWNALHAAIYQQSHTTGKMVLDYARQRDMMCA